MKRKSKFRKYQASPLNILGILTIKSNKIIHPFKLNLLDPKSTLEIILIVIPKKKKTKKAIILIVIPKRRRLLS